MKLKIRFVGCYVFSIKNRRIEYGINEFSMKQLEAFQLGVHRRLLKINWSDVTTNAEVMKSTGKDILEVLRTIKVKKVKYLGHIVGLQ